jgi:iron(III) transport system ATP-binding protein
VMGRPGVLLMDEPFSNLDQRLRDAVRAETLALIREMGATTIIVTHDPEDALRIADRIVLMRRGRIVQAGTAEEVYTRPANLYAARFFCDFNELPAMASGGQVESIFGSFSAGKSRDGTPVSDGTAMMLCIRPSSIVIGMPDLVARRLPDGASWVPGRVKARRFLGEVDMVEVAVAGLEKPLMQRIRAGAGPMAGTDVAVGLDASEVLVFEAADA